VREIRTLGARWRELEDGIWQKQLFYLSGQIVERVQKLMGSTSIEEIESAGLKELPHAGRRSRMF
jgi:hypothetical protein